MPKDIDAPSFQFYPDDFVSDGKVEAMTTEEVGAYLLLLCKAWREKPAATIPNDDRVLARWARLTPDRWTEAKAAVLSPWKLLKGDLRFMQPRLKREHDKMLNRRRERHESATTAATARWDKEKKMRDACVTHGNGTPDAMRNDAIPSSSSIPSSKKEEKSVSADADGFTPGFLRLWDASPPKARERSSRPDSFKVWKTEKLEPLADPIVDGMAKWRVSQDWTKDGGQFVPALHRWLKGRKWETPPLAGRSGNARKSQFAFIDGNG